MTLSYPNWELQLQSKKLFRINILIYLGIVVSLFTVRALTYIYILDNSFVAREFGVEKNKLQQMNFSFSKFDQNILLNLMVHNRLL